MVHGKPIRRVYYRGMKTSRMEMIGSAAAGVAHDINNQLNLIAHAIWRGFGPISAAKLTQNIASIDRPRDLLEHRRDHEAPPGNVFLALHEVQVVGRFVSVP
jgi:hypothetical protein